MNHPADTRFRDEGKRAIELEKHSRPASRASMVCGSAVALLAALALSFSLIADSFADEVASPSEPLVVLADAGVQPVAKKHLVPFQEPFQVPGDVVLRWSQLEVFSG